jgi:tetratricopeptide (TPR) repeat protein
MSGIKYVISFIIVLSFLISCNEGQSFGKGDPVTTSFLGKELYAPKVDDKMLTELKQKETNYLSDEQNIDNLIWYGRFLAYAGKLNEAIDIYTKGIEIAPDDARLYRHRGHRFITLRKLDLAQADLEKAVELIKGKTNSIEPDGKPNAENIPISTLHGNIYYHLGLVHFLKHDYWTALTDYQNCILSGANADNLVSASHWVYMSFKRLQNEYKAEACVEGIREDMIIHENQDYLNICLFYKGEISEEELIQRTGTDKPNDAVRFAIAHQYYVKGEINKAKAMYEEIVETGSWMNFGYIAAEKELADWDKMEHLLITD